MVIRFPLTDLLDEQGGRESGQIRLPVSHDTKQATSQSPVESKTKPPTTLYTDESNAYQRVAGTGRGHSTVCYSRGE